MLDENLNTNALPGAQDVPAADGGVSDSEAGQQVKELHEIVNDLTGKSFPTSEAAAKSIMDTFNATGKWGKFQPFIEKLEQSKGGEQAVLKLMDELTQTPAAPAPAPTPDVSSELKELQRQLKETQFYSDHPELKEHKALISKFGAEPEKVLEDETFKSVLEGLKARKEAETSRSVIHSNFQVQEESSDYKTDFEALVDAKAKGQNYDWVGFLKKHKGIELP